MTASATGEVRDITPEEVDEEVGRLRVAAKSRGSDFSFLNLFSSKGAKNSHGISNNKSPSDDGAEALVRAEARKIRNLRFALMCLIVAAATGCGVLIYKLSSKNETDFFKYSFNVTATKLTQNFLTILDESLNHAFIMGVSLGTGVYADSDYKPPFPNVTIAQFDTLTFPTRVHRLLTNIIWSPLLFTREERQDWEAFALSKLKNRSTTSSSSIGQYPPCYMCGEGKEFANPTATLSLAGIGTVDCAMVQQGAFAGYIEANECSYYAPSVLAVCGCQKSAQANVTTSTNTDSTPDGIFRLEDGKIVIDRTSPPYSPVWQISPSAGTEAAAMFNQMSEPWRREALNDMIDRKSPTFSRTIDPIEENILNISNLPPEGNFASFFFPVFSPVNVEQVVGSLGFDLSWPIFFNSLLEKDSGGVTIVLENTCGQMLTYQAVNGESQFQGYGDLHDIAFDSMIIESSFDDFNNLLILSTPSQVVNANSSAPSKCLYRIRIYPSQAFRSNYITNKPVIFTVIVVMAFALTSLVFLAYDYIVRRLQNRVLDSAKKSEAIVSSLFPALVRDRLFGNGYNRILPSQAVCKQDTRFDFAWVNHKARLQTYLSHPPSLDIFSESEPIADLYPSATVLFADIAGFTAWSSEREPSQVFKLLESLYREFDDIARELGVFKVETIGDCYVAVTGLPDKMKDHAVVMVEFAFRCLVRMHECVSQLEMVLGPGTADLAMRVGLHSGPVTAGVLRSERARFQLFGDTMNVASRMESTGKPDRVQISKETAQLLKEAGKEHWVTRRTELVSAKGKGRLQTYWAKSLPIILHDDTKPIESGLYKSNSPPVSRSNIISPDVPDTGAWSSTDLDGTFVTRNAFASGQERLVDWTTDLLQGLLHKVVVKRKANAMNARPMRASLVESAKSDSSTVRFVKEITEVIEMPRFDERVVVDPNSIDLGPAVRSQLRDYVGFIASLYRDNAFHNFEHACHVAMSASKLLKRIIAPDDMDYKAAYSNRGKSHKTLSKDIHDTTFGISSDPLMQFAVVFAALIHDADHTGVTNKQLSREGDPLAIKYQGKCVAEQRSIQVAWDTLMEDRFYDLRRCIYQTEDEKKRFRQLLVNAVIATDIADGELSVWRKNRWDKVFHQESGGVTDGESMSDRKATIVFEYIIQASDVAHTMQHWHVYQKWNKRLFEERYVAYLAGRETEDPSIGWHKGEISFFDHYIIPLAKKLEECRVFGVSCDEYLTYARQNRHEWEMKGEDIVRDMLSAFHEGDIDEDLGPKILLKTNALPRAAPTSLSVVELKQFNADVA